MSTIPNRPTLSHPLTRTLAVALVGAGIALGASGCNTTEGAGKDIKSLGKGIEETASDNKPK